MKLVLDTRTLLWTIGESGKLSETVIKEIKNPDNDVFVSAVSLWEIALKYSIGKLLIDFDVKKIPDYCAKMRFRLIPLDPIDALNSLQLPIKKDHKDPFNRMLIYQCITGKYILVSKDDKNKKYREEGLKVIW